VMQDDIAGERSASLRQQDVSGAIPAMAVCLVRVNGGLYKCR
jgi:hypothetical protein